ncbi:MAG: hypothetical protein OWQ48_00725 [Desulfurococcus sp.]|nr:hypothetical protein [Desulfurococcus sp.]
MEELAKRVSKAFSRYNCFIFEENELENVRNLIIMAELKGIVEVKQLDPRYPGIYIATVWTKRIERECISLVEGMLSKGQLTPEEYKKYRNELIEQCIVSMEIEESKKVVEALSRYIDRLKSTSEVSGAEGRSES